MKKILSVREKLGWQAGSPGDADQPLSASCGHSQMSLNGKWTYIAITNLRIKSVAALAGSPPVVQG
jgi:hypothetical protein